MTLTAPRPAVDAPVDARRKTFPAHRTAFVALLVATGLLYLWNLGTSGWANAFYSAAAQAASQSWTAFLFGFSDAANAITVDTTPAALWVMSLSVPLFGSNSWSVLGAQREPGTYRIIVEQLPRSTCRSALPEPHAADRLHFPGRTPYRPVDAGGFGKRVKCRGLTIRGGRNDGLIGLAAELPGTVLADPARHRYRHGGALGGIHRT